MHKFVVILRHCFLLCLLVCLNIFIFPFFKENFKLLLLFTCSECVFCDSWMFLLVHGIITKNELISALLYTCTYS